MAESDLMHDIKDQNKHSAKVSPVSCFLKKKCFHIIISFYVHYTTYICTSSVAVQLYIRKYSANIAIGSRESDRAASRVCAAVAMSWRHSGVTNFLAALQNQSRRKPHEI